MPDITIPDAAVEAAARLSREENPMPLQKEWDAASPWIRQMWMDDVRPLIAAAAPHIAAQALRDVASVWQRVSDPEFARSARRLRNVANRIEPDHG